MGRKMRVYREEVELRTLKETVGNKAKRKLEFSQGGSGWLTVLTSSQDGTDISKEEFRDTLRVVPQSTPSRTPPLPCGCCRYPLTVEYA